ncbi:MAG TPA: hypothetical protein VKA59_18410 [Vicinamibacterales bacterium]|jgi:hypothetical protein|nr:hypothetical protein [Vicinamibacterales bacterium]
MSNQPFALEAVQGMGEVPVALDTESEGEAAESLGASRGVLLAVALCLPFWTWVYSILF